MTAGPAKATLEVDDERAVNEGTPPSSQSLNVIVRTKVRQP